MNNELKLIFVSDDYFPIDDLFLISMEGQKEYCNPDILINSFPDIFKSVYIINEKELKEITKGINIFRTFKLIKNFVKDKAEKYDLCVIDDYDLKVFTNKIELKELLLSKLLLKLP